MHLLAASMNGRTACDSIWPKRIAAMTDLKVVTADPFDPEALRLDQSFVETSGVKKLLTTVPVKKPNNQDFVRVHEDEAYRLTSAIIELKDDREVYLVLPLVAHQLPGEVSP